MSVCLKMSIRHIDISTSVSCEETFRCDTSAMECSIPESCTIRAHGVGDYEGKGKVVPVLN
jgi:hypothetical protein